MTERPRDLDLVEIRLATVDDVDEIARVHVEAWQAGYAGLMPAAYLHGLDWQERAHSWRERLQDQAAHLSYLVATRGRLLGFSAFGAARDDDLPAKTSAELYAINVHSSAWSSGVGSALLRASLEMLSSCDVVVLWVLEANRRARRFYEAHGFRPDGNRKMIELGGVELPELRYRRSP